MNLFGTAAKPVTKTAPRKPKVDKVNLNDLAKEITLLEGGKINLSIAQVKEVLKLAFTHLANRDLFEVAETLRHYKK